MMKDLKQEKQRKSSFLATMKAVLWSFLGVRKKSGYEQDAQLNPVHVVIAAVIGFLIFITMLVIIVKIVVAK
ncbi:MAG: DUF2970 domain-containing protein [Glaciimonas sp.]|nr:DUF2970 domain-containing protein [Glaciimonas sp.]